MTTASPRARLLRSTFTGLTSQYLGVVLQGLVQLGVLALLARLLVPADFGLVGLATVFVGLASLFSQFGLGVAIIRLPVLTDRDVRAGFTLAVGLGLLTAILLAAMAPVLAALFRNPALVSVLRVLSLTFVVASPGFMAEALLERRLEWGRLMWVNLGAFTLGYAATGVGLALLGLGYWALVGSQLAQALLRSALLLRAQPHPKHPLLAGPELRQLTRFGGSFTLARLFNYGAQQGDYLVVGRVLGVTPLGLYTRAFKLMLLPVNYFAAIITKVLFPTMARLQSEPDRLALAYLLGSAVIAVVSAPVSALMVVTAPEIVAVILGPGWSAAVPPLQVLAAGILFRNTFQMAYCLDGALGEMRQRMVRDAIYAASVLLGSLLGVRYGLVGVSAAVLAAIVGNYFIAAGMSLRLLRASWSDYLRAQVPGLLLGVVTAALALLARPALLRLGAPPVLVLLGTWALAGTVLLLLLYFRPAVSGPYGVHALRLAADGLTAHGLPRGIRWAAPLSRGLARRVAAAGRA